MIHNHPPKGFLKPTTEQFLQFFLETPRCLKQMSNAFTAHGLDTKKKRVIFLRIFSASFKGTQIRGKTGSLTANQTKYGI